MRLRLAALVRVVLFSAWTLTVVAAPARAATLMSAATLQAGPGGGAVLTLDFAQSPQFVLAGRGTPEVTITFLDVQALNLPAFQSVGPVRAVEIAPSGSNLVVRLHLTAPLRIGISRSDRPGRRR